MEVWFSPERQQWSCRVYWLRHGGGSGLHCCLTVRNLFTWSLHVLHCLCAAFSGARPSSHSPTTCILGPGEWTALNKWTSVVASMNGERDVQGVPCLLAEGRWDRSAGRNPWKQQTRVSLWRVESQPTKSDLGCFFFFCEQDSSESPPVPQLVFRPCQLRPSLTG